MKNCKHVWVAQKWEEDAKHVENVRGGDERRIDVVTRVYCKKCLEIRELEE